MLKYSGEEIRKSSVKDIKSYVEEAEYEDFDGLIEILRSDSRKSVISLGDRLYRKKLSIIRESERQKKIREFENAAYERGYVCIAGIDEVGRGPLAGPVVAAAVILPKDLEIEGINDSKKLSEQKREELYDVILENAVDYGIGMADNNEIDDINILNATYLAMRRALSKLKAEPDCLLNDAVRIPEVDIEQVPIIKGDSKSISIAAASIVAKVTRDRMMCDYDKIYPGYGFASNKGYGTNEHYDGIRKNGITEIHRKSFLKNFSY